MNFLVSLSGQFWAASPANPTPDWLDFLEQCRALAAQHGRGEYAVADPAGGVGFRFWI